MNITVITDIPSPYQVELFDAVADQVGDFQALYVRKGDPTRQWGQQQARHDFEYLDDLTAAEEDEWAAMPGLLVFSYYGNQRVERLMRTRRASGEPWCFWGERLGLRHGGPLGRAYRRWKLRALHGSHAPIWGIGRWAVESYVREFGRRRNYYNVPYFSNLERFAPPPGGNRGSTAAAGRRVFLYSGSFIERKGVDLLARVFARVLNDHSHIELCLLGDGPLRPQLEARFLAVGNRVRFLGFKDWHELPGVYAGADVLCAPSRHDGWALVVPEGLAAGLPVISTDHTGAAIDLIRHGENGWIVKAGDEHSLETAVRAAAEANAEDLAVMKQSALTTAAEHSLEAGAERFLEAARRTIATWK